MKANQTPKAPRPPANANHQKTDFLRKYLEIVRKQPTPKPRPK